MPSSRPFEKKPKKPLIAHDQVHVVFEPGGDAGQRAIFLRAGEEDEMALKSGWARGSRRDRPGRLVALRGSCWRGDSSRSSSGVGGGRSILRAMTSCAAGCCGMTTSVKNWLCTAAQTTLLCSGAIFRARRAGQAAKPSGWQNQLAPMSLALRAVVPQHALRPSVSCGFIGVAVPTTHSCGGSDNALVE